MTAKKSGPVAARAKKPSTSAGGAAALSAIIPFLPPQFQMYGAVAAVLLGALAVYLPERAE